MAQRVTTEQRACQRAAVALHVLLARKVGNDVLALTQDLGTGGARVVSGRPLRVDEELEFDLELTAGGEHLSGSARVLRQHQHDMYALRFENVAPAMLAVLSAFVAANAGAPVV